MKLSSITRRLYHAMTTPMLLLVISASLFMLSLPLYLIIGHDERHKIVRSVQPAGSVVRITLHGNLFTRSLVETDVGFYALIGGVSLAKGRPLTLERRSTGDYLCDEHHRCTRLMGFWL